MLRLTTNLAIILGFLLTPFVVTLPWTGLEVIPFHLDVVSVLGVWWAGRLVPLIGLYLLLIEALPGHFGNRMFRLVAFGTAFALTIAAFFSFLTPLFHPLQVLPVPLAGLFVLRAPARAGRSGHLASTVGGIAILVSGLSLLLLLSHPTLAIYSSWRSEGPLSLRNILYRLPAHDFALASATGDLKAICLSGVGLVCPPYDEDEGFLGYKAMDYFGYNGVIGYSDAIMSGAQEFLQGRAYDYANTFNVLLLEHLEELEQSH